MWGPAKMSALLALVPLDQATGHRGQGDFTMGRDGRLARYVPGADAPLVNTGAQIIDTGILASIDQQIFSQNVVWDQLIASGRLFGCLHSGGWVDVGTPKGIELAEQLLAEDQDV